MIHNERVRHMVKLQAFEDRKGKEYFPVFERDHCLRRVSADVGTLLHGRADGKHPHDGPGKVCRGCAAALSCVPCGLSHRGVYLCTK